MSQDGIPLRGRLDVWSGGFDVPELLLGVCRSGRTGRLELTSREAQKRIYLDDGRIVFASSTSNDERLGIYLLLHHRLTLSDLRRLGSKVRPGVRLGSVLVEDGVLRAEELASAVSEQVRSIVLGLFHWTDATYTFYEEPNGLDEPITLSVPIPRLVVDGVEAVVSWRRIQRGLGSLDARFRLVRGNEEQVRSADLDRASLELLAILREEKSVEELCRGADLGDLEVCRRLWAFRALGWIEPLGEPALDSDLEGLGMIFGCGNGS